MVQEVRIEGDHGLVITMSKEMRDKIDIKMENGYHVITICTELWEEVIE